MTTAPVPHESAQSLRTEPISATTAGRGRESIYGTPYLHLGVDFTYHPDRPYEVALTIANHSFHCDVARWTVSREVLCNAAIWQTPAGACDFAAVPMSDTVVQLRLYGSRAEDPQALYVDVQRVDLLRFLERTLRAVKPGRESQLINMDSVIDALFDN